MKAKISRNKLNAFCAGLGADETLTYEQIIKALHSEPFKDLFVARAHKYVIEFNPKQTTTTTMGLSTEEGPMLQNIFDYQARSSSKPPALPGLSLTNKLSNGRKMTK